MWREKDSAELKPEDNCFKDCINMKNMTVVY